MDSLGQLRPRLRRIVPAVAGTVAAVSLALLYALDWGDDLAAPGGAQALPHDAQAQVDPTIGPQTGAHADTPSGKVAAAERRKAPLRPSQDVQLTHLAGRYADLSTRARNGEVAAAVQLHKALGRCIDAPRDDHSIDRTLELGEIAGSYSVDERAERRAFLEYRRQACAPLTDEQIGSYRFWLGLAAQLGDQESQLAFSTWGAPSDPASPNFPRELVSFRRDARTYIETQIQAGRPQALLAAFNAHVRGVVYAKDARKAYAYLYAYSLSDSNERGTWIHDLLAENAQQMSDQDLVAATEEGRDIWEACCDG